MNYRKSRCNCSCHSDSSMKHCMPCCTSCQFCWEDKIYDYDIEVHEATCISNPIHLELEEYYKLSYKERDKFHKKCDEEADRIRLERYAKTANCKKCKGDGFDDKGFSCTECS